MKKLFFLVLPFLIMIIAALYMLEGDLHAATYNFTFNNTEQGDNSTATPTVTIQDPKTGEVRTITPTTNDKSIEKLPESKSHTEGETKFGYVKVGAEYLPDFSRTTHSVVALVAILPFRNINLAANLLIGQTFGGEVEYRPWTGRFEIGAVAGILSYSGGVTSDDLILASMENSSDPTTKSFGGFPRAHLGLSGTFNIVSDLSISYIVRYVSPRNGYDPALGHNTRPEWINQSFAVAYRF